MSLDVARLGESPSGKAPGVPYSPLYDDVYHAVAGAAEQARYVFLGGNGLPERWQDRDQFVILETGFGLGNNFLQTWRTWREDSKRCSRLFFVSIEKHPLTLADLAQVHQNGDEFAQRLVQAWPVLTPGMHTLQFDDPNGQVTLLLGLGDVAELLPALVMQVDAFFLDGFAPAKNPQMWDEQLLSRLGRLAAPGCTAATWSVARSVRDGLTRAGFTVHRAPGFGGKRDMIRAVYEPRYVPQPPAGGHRPAPRPEHRHAAVVGAGLAGAVACWALARAGWQVTLFDKHPQAASEASGNPGGMFHAIVHGEDGIHARAHRAAALAVSAAVQPWIEHGDLAGQLQGLLRLDARCDATQAQNLIGKLGLPDSYVEWLEQADAAVASGLPVSSGGWLFKQAGWLHPAGLAQCLVKEAQRWAQLHGQPLNLKLGDAVHRLEPNPNSAEGWWVHTSRGAVHVHSVVLANAHGANELLQTLPDSHAVEPMPMSAIRGQVTVLNPHTSAQHANLPKLPVAGGGYALTLPDGRLLCGATTQHHDHCATVREADHAHNLRQASKLGALIPDDQTDVQETLAQSSQTWGRVGWRAATPDRLPLVGALPWRRDRLAQAPGRLRLDQTRMIRRERNDSGGLFVITGLGSRGITWSVLAGQLLAHWVAGTPCPLEADLRDALDPARFLARQKAQSGA